MKKLFLLVFVMMLAAGLAYSQNTATITQSGPTNTASATQTGIGNDADINQISYNTGNNMDVIQNGMGNTADSDQDGDSNAPGSITQLGEYNIARTTVMGNTNTTSQYQEGLENNARIFIPMGNINDATQSQTGEQNTTRVLIVGDYNISLQTQNGTGNMGSMTIFGNGAGGIYQDAEQFQQGNYNHVVTNVEGDANVSYMGQWNDTSLGHLGQTGNLNIAKLDQVDSGLANLNQFGDSNTIGGISTNTDPQIGESRGSSQLFVDQIGNTNMVGVYQNNSALANVLQTGDGNTATVNQQ